MKRGIDYAFSPTPTTLPTPWFQVSFYERAVGGEVFRVTGGQFVACGNDWRDTLCSQLAVTGRERPNVKRALSRLQDAGLIEVREDGLVRVCFAPVSSKSERPETSSKAESDQRPTASSSQADRTLIDSSSTADPKQNEFRNDLTLGDHSDQLEQIRIEESRLDKNRESFSKQNFSGAHSQEAREGWAEAYEQAGAGTPPVLAGQQLVAAVEFARNVARTHGKSLREAARAIAATTLASKRPGDRTWGLSRLDPYAPLDGLLETFPSKPTTTVNYGSAADRI